MEENIPPKPDPPAEETRSVPPAGTKSWFKEALVGSVLNNPGTTVMVIIVVIIVLAIWRGLPVIDKLAEPAFARGLITFVICLATVGLAFMLICYAFSESSDDRFKRAREIFAGMLGIMGTIVGFYFGAASTGAAPLALADIQVRGAEVATYVTGGAPPYQGAIKATGKFGKDEPLTLPKEAQILSDNGWVRFVFTKPLDTAAIEIEVKDSQNRTATRKAAFQAPALAGEEAVKGRTPAGQPAKTAP
jgi:hypothetical protein